MSLSRFLFALSILIVGLFSSAMFARTPFIKNVFLKELVKQNTPFTLAQILTGLQTQGKTPETRTLAARNKFIAARARQRGVAFELTTEREHDLRAAGASDELINVIREISEIKFKRKREAEAEEFYNSGVKHAEKGEFDKAIEQFNKAIELNPNSAGLYNNRGVSYFRKQNFDQAIRDYNKAIELNPNHFLAYYLRGLVYQIKGNYTQAIKDFTKAIELQPSYTSIYSNRSNAYDEIGEKAKAEADRQKVRELEKKP